MFIKKSLLLVLSLVLIYSCEKKHKEDAKKSAYVDTFSIMKQYDQAKIIEEKFDAMLRDKEAGISGNNSESSASYAKEIEYKKKAALDSLNKDVCKIIYQYAHNNGFDKVYGSSEDAAKHKGKNNDITQEIILLLNSQINYSDSDAVVESSKVSISKAISEKTDTHPENKILTNSGTDNNVSLKKDSYKNEVKIKNESSVKNDYSTKKEENLLELKNKIKEVKVKVKSVATSKINENVDVIKTSRPSTANIPTKKVVSESTTNVAAPVVKISSSIAENKVAESKPTIVDEKKELLRLAILEAKKSGGQVTLNNSKSDSSFFGDDESSTTVESIKEVAKTTDIAPKVSKSNDDDDSFFSDNDNATTTVANKANLKPAAATSKEINTKKETIKSDDNEDSFFSDNSNSKKVEVKTVKPTVVEVQKSKKEIVENKMKDNDTSFFNDDSDKNDNENKKEKLRLAILEAKNAKSQPKEVTSTINVIEKAKSSLSTNVEVKKSKSEPKSNSIDNKTAAKGDFFSEDEVEVKNIKTQPSEKANLKPVEKVKVSPSIEQEDDNDDDFFDSSSSSSESKKEALKKAILDAQNKNSNKILFNNNAKTNKDQDSSLLVSDNSNSPTLGLKNNKASVSFLVQILKEFNDNQNFLFSSLDSISSVFDKNKSNKLLVIEPGSKENRFFQSLTKEVDEKNIRQKELLNKFETMYNELSKNDSFASANNQYFNTLNKLNSDQKNIEKLYEDLFKKVNSFQNDNIANKIRLSQNKSKVALKGINKPLASNSYTIVKDSNNKPSSDKFDYGYQLTNLQVLKNVDNAEKQFYLIVAVHNDKQKAVSFINKAIASGENNINYFYSSKFDSYFIYTEGFNEITKGLSALENKNSKEFNANMVLVKFEK